MKWNWRPQSLKCWHFEASEDIMTKFKSQGLHIIRIKYWNASGSGFPPSLIPTLWNIGILLHKQATLGKHFEPKCKYQVIRLCMALRHSLSHLNGKWISDKQRRTDWLDFSHRDNHHAIWHYDIFKGELFFFERSLPPKNLDTVIWKSENSIWKLYGLVIS